MTDDELDLVASAYVDGQATPDEVALVEGDPELLARVAELRAVAEQVSVVSPAPDALRQQHLAAAMAQFASADTQVVAGAEGSTERSTADSAPGSVPSLADHRRDRDARRARRSMPQWMPAAAAFLLIGGGVVFLASRTGSDDFDAATDSADSAEFGDDADDSADSADSANSESRSMAAEASMAESAVEQDAMDGDAMDDAAMEEAMEDDAMEESAEVLPGDGGDGAEAGGASPAASTTTTGGLFPDEPVRQYDSVPTMDELLADLPAPRTDLASSNCGPELDELTEFEIVGFLPIEIGGEPAEVFAVLTESGSGSALIADENCDLVPIDN